MNLRKFTNEDMKIFCEWLDKPYIAKWYKPKEEWVEEVENRETEYDFVTHFIVEDNNKPIGFCQYYDYSKGGEDWHGNWEVEGTYSIDYLIGDEAYLGKGNGPIIVNLLTEDIIKNTDAKLIIVQPEPGNEKSRKTLLSAGYLYDETADLYYMDPWGRG